MTESFAELFEESVAQIVMKVGEVVMGEVVHADRDVVIVNAGLKSEAEIPAAQFKDHNGDLTVAVGDVVEVAIESIEDGFGNTRLSREKAQRARAWDELEQAQIDDEIVTGILTGKVKGGFTVAVKDIRAFLPGSLVDVRPVKDSAYLEGKELEFKVIKLDRVRNNIVVSRRAVVEDEMSEERDKLLSTLEEGQIVKGVVKNLTDYGAFVNLGGIDGLLHITDLAWKRVRHPSEVVEVGDEIEARVLKFDRERNRVSLGLKQLGEDPWEDLPRRFPENTRLFGKVTNLTDYGAFVELEEGVEGLVHVSEMDWTNKNVHPSKICRVGDEVEVMVLDVDTERRRISLGMKQVRTNPWEEFAAIQNKGDKLTGKVLSVDPKGATVDIGDGIEGYLRASELSRDHVEDARSILKEGEEVEAKITSIDRKTRKISLSVKALELDLDGEAIQEYAQPTTVATTLGEKLKEQLSKQTS